MYSRKVQESIICSKYNLKNFIHNFKQTETKNPIVKYSQLLRLIKLSEFKSILEIKEIAINKLQNCILEIPRNLKQESSNLLRVWTRQCECVIAQRVRRSQQMFSLYTKLWEEHALREFLKNIQTQISKHGKQCVFSAVGITAFNWDRNRISDEELRSHMNEIEYIQILKDITMKCQVCKKKPESVDKSIIAFCDCDGKKSLKTYDDWSLFIEQNDLIVWRRLHKSGCYEYKVYGSYNDVTAEDFLSVQIDTNYRKIWDTTAVSLEVIDRDTKPNSNSDLIYWEMLWPRLFSNRDYVFNRRFLIDHSKNTVMLLSKGINHPSYPAKPNKYRVADYWSSMVIRPYTEINKPGLEFSLTYFDNPGVNIPASVTAWVAYRAMPDFLTKLREATKEYRKYCRDHNCNSIYNYHASPSPSKVNLDVNDEQILSEVINFDDNIFDILMSNDRKEEHVANKVEIENKLANKVEIENKMANKVEIERVLPPSSAPGADVILSPSPIVQDQTYWKYLHPTYYLS